MPPKSTTNQKNTQPKRRPLSSTTVTFDDDDVDSSTGTSPSADVSDSSTYDDTTTYTTTTTKNNTKSNDNNNNNRRRSNISKPSDRPPGPGKSPGQQQQQDRREIEAKQAGRLQSEPFDNYERSKPPGRSANAGQQPLPDLRILRERLRDMRDRFQDVSDSLKCGVCGNIFLDPVQIVHPDCNHIYCERCLDERTVDEAACPECGFHFGPSLVRPAAAIASIILDQLVPCFFEPAGCTERVRFRELDAHERRCQMNPDRIVECICGKEMPVSQHAHHLGNDCPEFSFDCPHGCGVKLQRHEDYDCSLKPARCEFARFGCPFKGPRANMLKHNKDNFQHHMALMASRIEDLESETKKMHIDQRQLEQTHQQQIAAIATKRSLMVTDDDAPSKPGGSFQRSFDGLVGNTGNKSGMYSLADARVKVPPGEAKSDSFGGGGGGAFSSDRVLPPGLSRMNDLVRPKWNRFSQPKKVIESPKDGSYRFVRPFACAFVNNESLVMSDCKTTWLIDVETGSVRNTLDPLTVKERQLYRPRGVAVQELGMRVFVADSQADAVHVFSPWGEYSATFGKGKLKYPMGVTCFRNRVYVCDTHHATVQIFDSAGSHVGNLVDDYHGTPQQAACSPSTGLVYVTMNSTSDSYVLVVDHLGEFVTTFGSKGHNIGCLTTVRGVAVDQNENVFVTNTNQYKIQMFGKIPTKLSLRETRRWENKLREQMWNEDSQRAAAGATGADGDQADVASGREAELDFESRVQERLKKRPTEVAMPKFEYRVVDWLGDGGDQANMPAAASSAPSGVAISPNKQMLAVVDEIKNKIYIY